MRRPSLGQNGGDLSRLTSASSDSESNSGCSSIGNNNTTGNNSGTVITGCGVGGVGTSTITISKTYLPELLDSNDWAAKSRKRKERQDSTSSIQQDRKLIRSNSEEYIPNLEYDVIRRVSSHEDFKKQSTTDQHEQGDGEEQQQQEQENQDDDCDDALVPLAEIKLSDTPSITLNDESSSSSSTTSTSSESSVSLQPLNDDDLETVETIEDQHLIEKSPNLSLKYRLSPNRDVKFNKTLNFDNTDFDIEHERQRNNERFSKTHRTPGRKVLSPRKSSSSSSSSSNKRMIREKQQRDENCYKYDVSTLKNERRGFVSKHKYDDLINAGGNGGGGGGGVVVGDVSVVDDKKDLNKIDGESDYNDNNLIDKNNHQNSSQLDTILPWNTVFNEEVNDPIICQRFADNTFDHVNNSQINIIKLVPINNDIIHKTRDNKKSSSSSVSSSSASISSSSTPLFSDDKVKQINKRLLLLKKRVNQYEDKFESNYGHRPTQFDKNNDKIMKNLIGEMSKLKREKNYLKIEPKVMKDDSMVVELRGEIKLNKMKDTIMEIEKVKIDILLIFILLFLLLTRQKYT